MPSTMLVGNSRKTEPKMAPNSQSVHVDFDDDPTWPGVRKSCQPSQLIDGADAQHLGSVSSNEIYYRHLSEALDEALNLKPTEL